MFRLCLLVILPATLSAEVFKWADAQNRNYYSDRRHPNARILAVDPGEPYLGVEKVFDGDTIMLSNGEKIRLLGINTPEVAGRNKNAEAGGEAAKAWLKTHLAHKKVKLERDVEKQDKYHRTLAHVFTTDKEHINLELVRQGLAAVAFFPPNLKYEEQLLEAQNQAERLGIGIWAYPEYARQAVETLNASNYKGWKRITGRVQKINSTHKYSYLQLSTQVWLRIDHQWLKLFPPLASYAGKNLEARGWVSKQKDRFVLTVRHPADLRLEK